MPFAPHVRLSVRWGYTSPGGDVEEGQFRLSGLSGLEQPTLINQGMGEALRDATTRWWATPLAAIPSVLWLREVKLAAIDENGHYSADPVILSGNTTRGGGGAINHPPQDALVVSLMTDRRGATGRGRVFLPRTTHPLQDDYLLSVANVQDVATTFGAYLRDLGAITTGETGSFMTPVVASTKGYNSAVTAVRVGRAVDTMRSRRRSLNEGYTAPVNASPQIG